ncbi:hypothetical protein MBRA1_000306 [Malassezia brasiliensis]|uniref:Uncharacterized protein n=1 Tax=Malassezia brasiliensis TaxID=1821822 RepID=A0AAF0DTE9_9BASI|nr:hypothetical protein MBRA1_000306 [Malassezia brasiliensis]
MAGSALNSPLFHRDVLRRIVGDTLHAPQFPQALLDDALHADRDPETPLPTLTDRERFAIEEANKVLAMYRSTTEPKEPDEDKLYALQLQYTQAGCTILLRDLPGAQRILEMLARELRPRPQSTLSSSTEGMQLNAKVLGTLHWLSASQGQTRNADRYARWRDEVQSLLQK